MLMESSNSDSIIPFSPVSGRAVSPRPYQAIPSVNCPERTRFCAQSSGMEICSPERHEHLQQPFWRAVMRLIQRKGISVALFLALSLAAFAPLAYAQTAVDGAIGGTVLDATGAVVASATVTVQSLNTNAEQVARTDASGYFRALHLQPGPYNVTITAGGFDTYRAVNVTVQVGLLTDLQARLNVGA